MQVLARLRAGDREIDFGVATTKVERAAILAQRFRVYQRWAYYYEPRLRVDATRTTPTPCSCSAVCAAIHAMA
jgi:hypothetical protein